jgi:hypothetical protein
LLNILNWPCYDVLGTVGQADVDTTSPGGDNSLDRQKVPHGRFESWWHKDKDVSEPQTMEPVKMALFENGVLADIINLRAS